MELLYLVHYTNQDPSKWNELRCFGSARHQFPGVYCILHTSYSKPVFPGKYKIILPLTLLLRQDYHINIQDHNGIQSEHNTLFPHQFNIFYDLLLHRQADMHEIVFHHPVSIRNNLTREELQYQPNLGFVDQRIFTGTTLVLSSSIEWLKDLGIKCGYSDQHQTREDWIRLLHSRFL